MFLITNESLQVNQKIDKGNIKGKILEKITSNSLYLEKLVKSYNTVYRTTATGNVDCDLLDDYDYSLELCDHIYTIKSEGSDLIITSELDDNEFCKLAVNAIFDNKDKADTLISIVNVLRNKSINEDTFNFVSDRIISYITNLGDNNCGFRYLLHVLDCKIPDSYSNKSKCIESMLDYFFKKPESLGLICDSDIVFIKGCLRKYYSKEYNPDFFDDIIVSELPF